MGKPRKDRPYSGILKRRQRSINLDGLDSPEIIAEARKLEIRAHRNRVA
jgi:hypothetical protein